MKNFVGKEVKILVEWMLEIDLGYLYLTICFSECVNAVICFSEDFQSAIY